MSQNTERSPETDAVLKAAKARLEAATLHRGDVIGPDDRWLITATAERVVIAVSMWQHRLVLWRQDPGDKLPRPHLKTLHMDGYDLIDGWAPVTVDGYFSAPVEVVKHLAAHCSGGLASYLRANA